MKIECEKNTFFHLVFFFKSVPTNTPTFTSKFKNISYNYNMLACNIQFLGSHHY